MVARCGDVRDADRRETLSWRRGEGGGRGDLCRGAASDQRAASGCAGRAGEASDGCAREDAGKAAGKREKARGVFGRTVKLALPTSPHHERSLAHEYWRSRRDRV